jgi:competence protein ComEC
VIDRIFARYAPHLLAGALCLGLAAANLARAGEPVVLLVAAAAAVASVVAETPRREVLLALALALGGLWWGSARLGALDHSVLAARVGETGPALVEVTGPARRTPFQLRVSARIKRFRGLSFRESVLLQLPLGRSPPQGALIESVVELRAPRGPDDGFDERTFLRRRGVHVVARGRGWKQVGRRGGLGGIADRIHRELARSIAPGLSGERRAVLDGLVLGEDEALSQELRDRFRSSGLYHLLAVSGSNVAFVAGGVLLVAWLAGISRFVGEVAALAAIGAYVLAVGWQPSVVRAGVAGALASLAWLASRPRDRWYFLLVGAALLLAWSPYSLLDPGFQLSFAAVSAIFVAVPAVQRSLEGYPLPKGLREVVAVSGACGVATAPILLLQFGSVPTYSILSNALAAPAVPVSFGLALLTAVLAHVLPPAAFAAAWANGWLAAYVAGCARVIGALPGARIGSSLLLAAVGAGALLLYGTRRLPAWRRPGLAVLAGLAVLLLVSWQLGSSRPPPPPGGLRLTVLDVGQGDGILLQVPQGAVLVDEGPPEAQVDDQLRDLGIRRLALMVLTHPQRDHVGGAADVLRTIRVDRVLDPELPFPSPYEDDARAQASKRSVPVTVTRAGEAFTLGKLRLRILWPDGPGSPGDDPNNHATIILASYGQVDVLLTADAESDVTLPLNLPQVEVMKVAHHGSSDHGLGQLLQVTRPRIAIISCGRHNDYGHPAPSTLAALAGAHLRLFRTDLDGRVVVESDGRRISTWSQH